MLKSYFDEPGLPKEILLKSINHVLRESCELREDFLFKLFQESFSVPDSVPGLDVNYVVRFQRSLNHIDLDIPLPSIFLTNLLKIYFYDNSERGWGFNSDLLFAIRIILARQKYLGQITEDVFELVPKYYNEAESDDTKFVRIVDLLEVLHRHNCELSHDKLIEELFLDVIFDRRQKLSLKTRLSVLNCFFLVSYDIEDIPGELFLDIWDDAICTLLVENNMSRESLLDIVNDAPEPEFTSPILYIEFVLQHAAFLLVSKPSKKVEYAYLIAKLYPLVIDDDECKTRFFNYFVNTATAHETRLKLRRVSKKILSSYLFANGSGNIDEIALNCLKREDEVALFLVDALYEETPIPVSVLEKIYKEGHSFFNNFNWFTKVVADHYEFSNTDNSQLVRLLEPFLMNKQFVCATIVALNRVDHFGLSSHSVFDVLMKLIIPFVENMELSREGLPVVIGGYAFFYDNGNLRARYNAERIFDVPVYLAKQAKFGNKESIIDFLTKGYCYADNDEISRSCLNGLRLIGGEDFFEKIRLRKKEKILNLDLGSKGEEIPEKFKIKIRENWLEKRQLSRYYASHLKILIELKIISPGDTLGTAYELLDIAPVRNAEDLSRLDDLVLDMYHETGFRFFKAENDNVSIISIYELSELN